MKKSLIALVLVILALLIGLGVFLVVQFIGLTDSAEPEPVEQDAEAITEYVKEHWPDFDASYDPSEKILTLSQPTKLSYEAACDYGGNIYCDELAPESYLPQARSIAIDIMGNCGCSGVNVVLSYESTEGKPVFTVNSNGTVWVCWEDAK